MKAVLWLIKRVHFILTYPIYVIGIGQAVFQLLSFKVGSEITKQESPYSRNSRKSWKYEAHFTENDITTDKS